MKTAILFLFTSLLVYNLHAQIILNTSDLPVAGDVQISVNADSVQGANLAPGSAGANVVWDFSYLLPCCTGTQFAYDTLSWMIPSGTPYFSSFPLSNLAYKKDCFRLHSHITHKDEEFCNFTYGIKNNEGVLLNGYYKNDVKEYEKMRFLFPLMKYGDTLQRDSRLVYYSSADTLKVSYVQNISIADGWGTVITPLNSVPALRVYTTEIIYDSIYVRNIGKLQSTSDSNFYFHWYAKNLGFPVMQIFKGSLHQENTYYQQVSYAANKSIVLSTPEAIKTNIIKVINNWGSRTVTFIFPEDISATKYFIALFDITGRKINPPLTLFSNKINASLDHYPSGMYIYKIGNASQILKTGKLSML